MQQFSHTFWDRPAEGQSRSNHDPMLDSLKSDPSDYISTTCPIDQRSQSQRFHACQLNMGAVKMCCKPFICCSDSARIGGIKAFDTLTSRQFIVIRPIVLIWTAAQLPNFVELVQVACTGHNWATEEHFT
jgi:hypothetical protein